MLSAIASRIVRSLSMMAAVLVRRCGTTDAERRRHVRHLTPTILPCKDWLEDAHPRERTGMGASSRAQEPIVRTIRKRGLPCIILS